ncbi:MAG TPA: DUF2752 domain-containing protein [Solirubrobacteraceae bacterium]|nr:DUF2752 domain-containing protein [Solirubrobacteraceae bacterium]
MPDLICPFRAATGLPCPLCGSTRAVLLAAQGDPRFLDYNAVMVAVLAVVAGLWLLRATGRGAALRAMVPRGRPLAALWVGVLALAWGWALAHQDTIVG